MVIDQIWFNLIEHYTKNLNEQKKLSDNKDLIDFYSQSLGMALNETYQRLLDCCFSQEVPELPMLTVAH